VSGARPDPLATREGTVGGHRPEVLHA
jgi:hypothetical protein